MLNAQHLEHPQVLDWKLSQVLVTYDTDACKHFSPLSTVREESCSGRVWRIEGYIYGWRLWYSREWSEYRTVCIRCVKPNLVAGNIGMRRIEKQIVWLSIAISVIMSPGLCMINSILSRIWINIKYTPCESFYGSASDPKKKKRKENVWVISLCALRLQSNSWATSFQDNSSIIFPLPTWVVFPVFGSND